MNLLTGLQFDICYLIKTRAGFEIAEITRFFNYFTCRSFFLLKVINLEILESSQEYVCSEVIKLLNAKLLTSNFSVEIFLWKILQLRLNENVWSYYFHQKEFVGLTVNKKKIRLKYLVFETPCTFFFIFTWYFSFAHT